VVVLTAVLGLLYNFGSLSIALSGGFVPLMQEIKAPYFLAAFYTMSSLCITVYLAGIVCGIDLLRSRLRWSKLLTAVLLLEVAYFFAVGFLWTDPTIGMSVGAATGVANGGLMFQFLILMPLWAPLVLWWARVNQAEVEVDQHEESITGSHRPPDDNPYASP
jgi:hypothetical protein